MVVLMVIKPLDIEVTGEALLDWGHWSLGPQVVVRKAMELGGLKFVSLGLNLGPLSLSLYLWHYRG